MEINKNNPYALLGGADSNRINIVQSAESELNKLVSSVVFSYDQIKQAYPKVGIGDTATDEAIAHRIYHAIHFREMPKK